MIASREQQYVKSLEQLEPFLKKYHLGEQRLGREALMASISSVIKHNIPDLIFVGFYVVVDYPDAK